MGGGASIEHMSPEDLYRTAEEAGVTKQVREKIRDEEIDGAIALEYASFEGDELTHLTKEFFPDAVAPRGKMKAALKKLSSPGGATANPRGGGGGGDGGGGGGASDAFIGVPVELRFKPESDLTLGTRLGAGGFSTVFRARFERDGRRVDVAFKRIEPELLRDARDVAKVEKEVATMHAVALHPNVATLLGVSARAGAADALGQPVGVGLMLELAKQSLYDVLHADGAPPPSWPTRLALLLDIARGMHALSSHLPNPIVHRDLKSPNVRAWRSAVGRERERERERERDAGARGERREGGGGVARPAAVREEPKRSEAQTRRAQAPHLLRSTRRRANATRRFSCLRYPAASSPRSPTLAWRSCSRRRRARAPGRRAPGRTRGWRPRSSKAATARRPTCGRSARSCTS